MTAARSAHIYTYTYAYKKTNQMGLSRDRDVSSVLSGYRDMRGHDQAIEAAKRRARAYIHAPLARACARVLR